MKAADNTMESITDVLSLRILRGEAKPGSSLPGVRALAVEFGVNVSTIQRVLARLQERGLVVAVPRSGVRVCDAAMHGGAGLWSLLLRAEAGEGARAYSLFRDMLETRRSLAVSVVKRLYELEFRNYRSAFSRAVENFGGLVEAGAPSAELADAEAEILRVLLVASERPAVLAIFNDVQRVLATQPAILDTIYSAPEENLAGWRVFFELLQNQPPNPDAQFVEPILKSVDDRALASAKKVFGSEEK